MLKFKVNIITIYRRRRIKIDIDLYSSFIDIRFVFKMEHLTKNVGWKTVLLVQFQAQYVTIILAGIYITTYCVIHDAAHAFSKAGAITTPTALSMFLIVCN